MAQDGSSIAVRHACRLLAELGLAEASHVKLKAGDFDHPALAWRRSGLMDLAGAPDGRPLMCPAAIAAAADGALAAFGALLPNASSLPAAGSLLLGERARLLGLTRGGRMSANRSCFLLDTRDGRIALNMAREDDVALIPFLVEQDGTGSWELVLRDLRERDTDLLLTRGIELGLAIAKDSAPRQVERILSPVERVGARRRAPLVIDFSALWAGPLATSLLAMAGAEVIKVESRTRLDGARRGHAGFYDLLNAAKRSVVVDFADASELARLRDLVERADIVVEGSRPRALRQLGIDRDRAVRAGATWVSITAHGAAGVDRIGFGDDAGVEAGLSSLMEAAWGETMFVGDAIADPLTGIYAALAAWAHWTAGGGRLVELSLVDAVRHAVTAHIAEGDELEEWQERALADRAPMYPLRKASGSARSPGADNVAVFGRC